MFYIFRHIEYAWLILFIPFLTWVYSMVPWFTSAEDGVQYKLMRFIFAVVPLLSFILALKLNQSLRRNLDGFSKYSELLNQLLATSMILVGFTEDELRIEYSDDSERIKTIKGSIQRSLMNIRHILTMLPGLIKWHFRSRTILNKSVVGRQKLLLNVNYKLYYKIDKISQGRLGDVEATLLILGNEMENFCTHCKKIDRQSVSLATLMAKWNVVYTQWCALNNTFGYEDPQIVNWYMNVLIAFFTIFFPIGFVDIPIGYGLLITTVIGYCYIGLYTASCIVSNPFKKIIGVHSNSVSRREKNIRDQINTVFDLGKQNLDNIHSTSIELNI